MYVDLDVLVSTAALVPSLQVAFVIFIPYMA